MKGGFVASEDGAAANRRADRSDPHPGRAAAHTKPHRPELHRRGASIAVIQGGPGSSLRGVGLTRENGIVESFHSRLRDGFTEREEFTTLGKLTTRRPVGTRGKTTTGRTFPWVRAPCEVRRRLCGCYAVLLLHSRSRTTETLEL